MKGVLMISKIVTHSYLATKYGWIYIKQTQNDNLTSDPPSALLVVVLRALGGSLVRLSF